MQFGQPLIFDLGFREGMRHRDFLNLVQQIVLCHGINQTVSASVFRPSTTVSRIGLMKSRLRCRCRWCGGLPPPTPLAG